MEPKTLSLWEMQDRHKGDRWRLFRAIATAAKAETVLYPGSYVDVAPSFVFRAVTYVDVDARANRFFADRRGVEEIIRSHDGSPADPDFRFIHADYTTELGLDSESFDLLVSLYAGFISASCTRYLRVGGTLLVNPSHGDAALASLDDRYVLSGVVKSRSGDYKVSSKNLDGYLIPKSTKPVTEDLIRQRGKGVAYTKPAFAYLFTRIL